MNVFVLKYKDKYLFGDRSVVYVHETKDSVNLGVSPRHMDYSVEETSIQKLCEMSRESEKGFDIITAGSSSFGKKVCDCIRSLKGKCMDK